MAPTMTDAPPAECEARPLKEFARELVTDTVEDGVRAAKRVMRTVRRQVDDLADLKDEALHRVKRQPLQAVTAAFGVGLVFGVAVGWIARRPKVAR